MREATDDDISDILRMAKSFTKALEQDYDEASVIETAKGLISNPTGILLVSDHGMAGAMVVPSFLDYSSLNAAELFWWIDEDHRGGGAGIELLNGLESWAREMGAKRLSMISMSSLGRGVRALYEKHGFVEAETTFAKEL